MREFCVSLIDLHFKALIGLYEQERIAGNDFRVNLSVWYDAARFEEENLDTGISYADLFTIVNEEMTKVTLLLETVALRIEKRVLDNYPFITRGEISIVKLNPPIPGIEGDGGVTLRFSTDNSH